MPSMQPSPKPDPKGEKIILITNQESAEKSSILKLGRELDYGDFLYTERNKIGARNPVLGSGKNKLKVALEKNFIGFQTSGFNVF